jgi:hypothetical protein
VLSHRERAAKVLKVGDSFTTSRTFTKDDVLRAMLYEGDSTNELAGKRRRISK